MRKLIYGIVGLFALLSFSSCGYNSMVKLDEQVQAQWGQVQNVYKRRADLIPNLVSTVKGAANFEQGTLVAVTEARAKATQMKIDASSLTPESLQKFQETQGQLSQALGKLLSITENYPELKANANFQELQAQLEGTENRITVERQKFNDVTKDYNAKVRSFPNNLTAGMFGFKVKPYFTAGEADQNAPEVKF